MINMKTKSGFSLVELIVALAVVSVLVAIAAPSFSDMLAQNRLNTQANDLSGAIQFARNEAVKRNQVTSLCRTNSDNGTSCTSGSSWEHWIIVLPSGTVIRRGSINSADTSIKLTSTLTNSRVIFRPSGFSDVGTNSDSLTLCSSLSSSNNIRNLSIGTIGRVTLTHQSGGC